MNQLEEVGIAHGHGLIEGQTGTTIPQLQLAGILRVVHPTLAGLLGGFLEEGLNGLLGLLSPVHLIEGNDAHAAIQVGCRPTHQQLEHLTHIHPARHTQGVEHDVDRGAVGQIGHVLPGKDAADDAFVAVAAGHLVADLDLAALGHINPHHHVRTGGQLITLFTGVDAHIHNAATLGAGHTQGVVAHIAGLLTKDRAKQLFFGGLIRFALGRHFAHEDVAAFNERTNTDNAHLVEVAETFLSDVGNFAGDFLGSELGLTRFDLVLLDVNRGVEVVGDQTLADQQRVLVVVTLPGHVSDQNVLTQGDLTAFTGRAIRHHLTDDHRIAAADDWALVQAGVLVGALILLQEVGVVVAVLVLNNDGVGIHIGDSAVHPGDRHHAGVASHLGFQAGAHQGTLGTQ